MEQTPNKSQYRRLTPEKELLPLLLRDTNSQPFDHESGTLPTNYLFTAKHATLHIMSPVVTSKSGDNTRLAAIDSSWTLFNVQSTTHSHPRKTAFMDRFLKYVSINDNKM